MRIIVHHWRVLVEHVHERVERLLLLLQHGYLLLHRVGLHSGHVLDSPVLSAACAMKHFMARKASDYHVSCNSLLLIVLGTHVRNNGRGSFQNCGASRTAIQWNQRHASDGMRHTCMLSR